MLGCLLIESCGIIWSLTKAIRQRIFTMNLKAKSRSGAAKLLNNTCRGKKYKERYSRIHCIKIVRSKFWLAMQFLGRRCVKKPDCAEIWTDVIFQDCCELQRTRAHQSLCRVCPATEQVKAIITEMLSWPCGWKIIDKSRSRRLSTGWSKNSPAWNTNKSYAIDSKPDNGIRCFR